MVDYLKGELSDLEEVKVLTGTSASPAAEHIYTSREECNQKKLDNKRETGFPHAVAQLLLSFLRARNIIQAAVSFLTKRFRDPDEDNWGKLKLLLRYIRRTINLPLILRADSLTIIKWWIYASYSAHPYMKIHTGDMMYIWRDSVIVKENKYRINSKSSVEAE